jgi:uncharacterized protein Yka (UPF0111/DUF47 family)
MIIIKIILTAKYAIIIKNLFSTRDYMLKRFLPKQTGFFDLFQKTAENLVSATTQFHHMLHDLPNQQNYVDIIAKYVADADLATHSTYTLLHKTFITPFDRYDIHHLIGGLDKVLYIINRCAQRFPIYQLNSVPTEMCKLAKVSMQSTILLNSAISQLKSLQNSSDISNLCDEIDKCEVDGHLIVLAGEKKLFAEEDDFKQFFKLKEIYSHTKLVINHCQVVGNMIRGIVLEYS